MSKTWRHIWKYRAKDYWKKEIRHPEYKIQFHNDYILEIHGWVEEPKDRSFWMPEFAYSCFNIDRRTKWVKKLFWHKFRHKWKKVLHCQDWDRMEKLSPKPDDHAWFID